jgi:hypothetical protein
MKTALALLAVVAAALFGWWAVRSWDAGREAMARADSLHAAWTRAADEAEKAGNALALAQERTEAALATAAAERWRADSLAEVARRDAEAGEAAAIAAGATLAETLRTVREASPPAVAEVLARAESQLAEHLAADARTVAAFRSQIAALSEARGAEVAARSLWEERATLAEAALDAERVSCRLCMAEVVELRKIANPGFLAELWHYGKGFALGAGTVLLLVVAR